MFRHCWKSSVLVQSRVTWNFDRARKVAHDFGLWKARDCSGNFSALFDRAKGAYPWWARPSRNYWFPEGRSGFLCWCETFYFEGVARRRGGESSEGRKKLPPMRRGVMRLCIAMLHGWNPRVKSSRTNQLFWTKKRRTSDSNRLDSRDAMNAMRAKR